MQRYLGSLPLALTTVIVFGVLGLPSFASATLYAPGATLDPTCAPTDMNCGVLSAVASSTANSIPYYAVNGSILSATSSVTILTSGTLSAASLALANALTALNGGTGSTTLTGILVGNGTSAVKSLVVGSGLTFDGTTLATNGTGITALGPVGELQSGG